MRASPYDLPRARLSPVAIETPEGKAEYVAAQRGFAARGARSGSGCSRCAGAARRGVTSYGRVVTSTRTDRWLHLDGTTNTRDLGGLPTVDGGETVSGRILRSDNLQTLSEDDVAHAGRRGRPHRGRRPAHDRGGPDGGPQPAARRRHGHPPALHAAARAGHAHRRLRRRGVRRGDPAQLPDGLGRVDPAAPGRARRRGRVPRRAVLPRLPDRRHRQRAGRPAHAGLRRAGRGGGALRGRQGPHRRRLRAGPGRGRRRARGDHRRLRADRRGDRGAGGQAAVAARPTPRT